MGLFDHLNRTAAAVFGEAVTVTIGAASPKSVRGIFDRRHLTVPLDEGSSFSGAVTTLDVLDEETAGIARGDAAAVGATTYRVVEVQPLGGGMTRLLLEIAS